MIYPQLNTHHATMMAKAPPLRGWLIGGLSVGSITSRSEQDFKTAVSAPEAVKLRRIIVHLGPAYRGHGRTHFITDPATGALTLPADVGAIVDKALRREARRLGYAIYLLKARLYLEALCLKGARLLLDLRSYFGC